MFNNKLVHIKQKEVFEEKLRSGEILDGNIVFIQDTQEIWTHGQLYFCEYLAGRVKGLEEGLKSLGDLSGESIQNLQSAITDLDGKKIDKSLAEEIHEEINRNIENSLKESKDYTDAKDSEMSNRVTNIEKDYKSADDSLLKTLKDYTDTAESNANQYTDDSVDQLKRQVDKNVEDINKTIDNNATNTTTVTNNLDERLQSIENLIDTDSDAVIDKWEEVVDFLNNIGAENDLEALLAAKANVTSLDETNRKVTSLVNADKEIRSEISTIETDLSGKITQAESSFVQTADEILQEVNRVETTLDGKLQENKASISTTADAIRSEVSTLQTNLEEQIQQNISTINQTASDIRAEVKTVKDGVETNAAAITMTSERITSEVGALEKTIDDEIKTVNSTITQTAEEIRQEVSATTQGLDGRLTTAEANVTVNANRITSEVSRIDGDLEEASTRITQTADKLQSVATTVDGHTSSLTQTAKSIESLVKNDEEINGVLTSHDSRITQTSKDITAAVTRITDVETSTANLKIQADSIEQSVVSTKEDLEGQITTVENTTKSYADKIETRLSETINGVEGRVTTVETDLDGITQRVEKTEEGVAGAATKTYATQIEQKANEIQLTVKSQTEQIETLNTKTGSLETRVSTAESSIQQLSDSIELKVATTDFQSLQNEVEGNATKISENTAAIKIANESISSKVSQTDFNALDSQVQDNIATLSEHSSEITQTKESISQKVSSNTFDAYKATVTAKFTSVEQSIDGIETKIGSAEGNITSIQEDITGLTSSLGTANASIESLQRQYDGAIDTFFGKTDPTLTNDPASNWNTTDLKKEHNGDIYYNTATGAAWRYAFDGTTASWTRITDEALTAALKNIETLTRKIDDKVTVFYTKPTEYKHGDIWFADTDYSTTITGWSFNIKENSLLVASGLTDSTTSFKWSHWSLKGDVKTKLSEFDDDVSDTWADGVLTDAEKVVLEESKRGLENAYKELGAAYSVLITTSVGKNSTALNNVKSAKTTLDTKYNALKTAIDTAINNPNDTNFTAYKTAYTNYSAALVAYDTKVAELTEANQATLSKANDYIKDITSDGKLTPIEKKQLFNIWKGIVQEFTANQGIAVNYKIIDSDGNKRSDIYSKDTYYNIYLSYFNDYTKLRNIFTNSDWAWNDFENTTTIPSGTLSDLNTMFENYYVCLKMFSKMISEITIEITDAHQKAKDYVDWVGNHLKPEDNVSVVGKGVVLSTILGVKSSTDDSFTSALNASSTHADNTSSKHGRIVFAGGINKAANGDWNNATTVIYEDGHIKFNSGEIGEEVKIGNAVITTTDANNAALKMLCIKVGTKNIPIFTATTDSNNNVTSINCPYNFNIEKNLITKGDVSSSDSSGTTGGSVSSLLKNWTDYNATTHSGYALAASLGVDLNNRVKNLESGSALSFSSTGAGNVVTSISKNGTTVTFTKGITALTAHQNIYSLTIQKNGTTIDTFSPTNASKTINIADVASANTLSTHISNKENPHNVTKSQIGLSNVENTTLSTWTGTSNLTTCNRGAFGTIVTKATSDYLSSAGGTLSGNLTVTGTSTFTGNTTNKAIAYFAGGTTYYINTSGAAKFASLTTTGAGTIGTTLNVGTTATIGSTLTVSGTSTFGNKLTVSKGGAEITGDVKINGNIIVTGDSASSGTGGGTSTGGSNVTVTGVSTTGNTICTITVDGVEYPIKAPDRYQNPYYEDGLQISTDVSLGSHLFVPYATGIQQGVVKSFHHTTGTVSGTKTNTASDSPAINKRSNTSGRYYGIETDKNGTMFVNVPWTDTVSNNTYSLPKFYMAANVFGQSVNIESGSVLYVDTGNETLNLSRVKPIGYSDGNTGFIIIQKGNYQMPLTINLPTASGVYYISPSTKTYATTSITHTSSSSLLLYYNNNNNYWIASDL